MDVIKPAPLRQLEGYVTRLIWKLQQRKRESPFNPPKPLRTSDQWGTYVGMFFGGVASSHLATIAGSVFWPTGLS